MRLLGLALILILFAGCTGTQEESSPPDTVVVEETPPAAEPYVKNVAEAKALFEKTCDECHPINYPATRGGRSHMAWVGTVNDMIDNGAIITDEEAALIAGYLADTYGPE